MGEGLKRARAAARATRAEPSKWVMPAWMEPFREMIRNTGGNSVEELYNDRHTTTFENAPRAILCVAVKSQVDFLYLLQKSGRLRDGVG